MRHTYTTSITLLRDYVQNSDVAEAKLATLLNLGNTRTRMSLGIHKIRGTTSFKVQDVDTHANKYFLPPQAAIPVSVKVEIGDNKYPVLPFESQLSFDYADSANLQSDQAVRFLYNGRALQLYPQPSEEHTLHVVFEEVEKELSNADVTTGTVESVENDKTLVKFSADSLSLWMDGAWFKVDTNGFWYKIDSVNTDVSPHQLTLEQPYLGTTIDGNTATADKAYNIGEQFDLPDELQEAPVIWAAHRYFQAFRRNDEMRRQFGGEWVEMMTYGIGKYGPRTSIHVMKSKLRRLLGAVSSNDFPTISTTEL